MTQATREAFEKAQQEVQGLSKKPGNETLLKLYALYKQGTAGDVTGDRPGRFDFVGGAKYDAWAARRGQSQEDVQREYAALVETLKALG